MSYHVPELNSPGSAAGQPGMEVVTKPEVFSLLEHSANNSFSTNTYARKPVPIYSSTPVSAYSDNPKFTVPEQPYASPARSNERVIAFVIGFLCSAIIIGASLGGGLGAHLASCQRSVSVLEASKTSPTPSASTASAAPATSTSTNSDIDNYQVTDHAYINTLHNTCTQATVVNMWGDTFLPACGKDFNSGFAAAEGGILTDIASLIAYSFEDCMNMCSGLNNKAQTNGFPVKCLSIAFSVNMKNTTEKYYANCWLKNGTMKDVTSAYVNSNSMSAKLIT